jgi:acetyl-CoA acetyltransferase
MVAQRHMHEFGTTSEQLAEIAVTMRRHAGLNPQAKYREPITVEDVLASRMISSPLHLLDCCVISDGGGALVLTSLERARDLRKPPVVILGGAEALRHGGRGVRDVLDIAASQSGPLAFERAGLRHDDVDLCAIYDSYTITVLATLEALGFCRPGEGRPVLRRRPHRARRRAAGQSRRRRPLVEPPRDARHLPRHRGDAAAPPRVRRAPGGRRGDRARARDGRLSSATVTAA